MKINLNLNLKAKLVQELKAGELFAYESKDLPFLGIFLEPNSYGYNAVALTTGRAQVPPAPVAGAFRDDATVLGYENTTFSVDRQLGRLGFGEVKPGGVAFTPTGSFLRCVRDKTAFDLNLETGELKQPSSHIPAFWSPKWKIIGAADEVIFEWPGPLGRD